MDSLKVTDFLSGLMDPALRWHHRRVALYARRIAAVLCPGLVNEAVFAALFHDTGKICIPDEILFKPGVLTRKEWELVRLHPLFGAQLLQKSKSDRVNREVITGVMHHHERWDGAGYPHGLEGMDIPIVSRILAVADSYDAMTSYRPYKSCLKKTGGLMELQRHAGTQFDPEVVAVFLRLMSSGEKAPCGC
ncbi:MAG: HD domain-containing protein [Peptococcaceae bacterium]|nr:HD domain-containing protein [Peptococcaceae bacterium]